MVGTFTRQSRRLLPVIVAATCVLSVGATVGVQHLLRTSLSVTNEFVGTIGVINFDGSKGCVTVSGQDSERCGSVYTHAKLKVGDKVHVWVETASALPNGAEIYLVVPEPK
jgi:hypothetical protein